MPKSAERGRKRERPPRPRRSQARGIVTRGRLLEVARDLFAREGFAAVSLAAIARRAGYGMSTVYHHFRDTREVLLQLIDDWGKTMPVQRRAALDIKTALGGDPRRAAHEYLRKTYDLLRKGPSFYRVIVTEAERDPEVRRRYEAAHQTFTVWMAGLVRVAQETGVMKPDRKPDAAAFLLHHVIESTLTELVAKKFDPKLREDVLDELEEMIVRYLLGVIPRPRRN